MLIWIACLLYVGGVLLRPAFERKWAAMQPHSEFYGHKFGIFHGVYRNYLSEHAGKCPPLNSPNLFLASVRHDPELSPRSFEEITELFIDPNSGQPYHLNGWLSGKNIADLPDPDGIAAIYEDAMLVPNHRQQSSGRFMRAVLFADGWVTIIEEDKWPQIKKQSHID